MQGIKKSQVLLTAKNSVQEGFYNLDKTFSVGSELNSELRGQNHAIASCSVASSQHFGHGDGDSQPVPGCHPGPSVSVRHVLFLVGMFTLLVAGYFAFDRATGHV
jgi:hypothetical protein